MWMLKQPQRVIWYVEKKTIKNKNKNINLFFSFQLSKLTIPMLKDYCRDKKLRASGTKKQDFIDAIQSHLGIA